MGMDKQARQATGPSVAPEPVAPFERRIDARLIASIVASGSLSFCAIVFETAMNVAMPVLMREFSVDTGTIQWITSGYLLMLSIVIPAFSFLKARVALRALFCVAAAAFAGGTIACALAPSFPVLLAGRLVQGMGTGVAIPLMFSIVVDQVPHDRMGLMMGFAALLTALAPAVGPSYGGLVMSIASWRAVFASLLPLVAVAVAVGAACIRQATPLSRPRFDVPGFALVAVGFVALVYGIGNASHAPLVSVRVGGCLLACVVALAAFARHELFCGYPLLDVRAFGVKPFACAVVSYALISFAVLGYAYLVPNYAQLALGEAPLVAGSLLLPGCLSVVVLAPVGGRLLDRLGALPPVALGMTLMAVSPVMLAVLAGAGVLNAPLVAVAYLLFGVGEGFAFSNVMAFGIDCLPEGLRTDGNVLFNTMQQLGGSIGVSVLTAVVGAAQAGAVGAGAMRAVTAAGGLHAFAALAVALGSACALVAVSLRAGRR